MAHISMLGNATSLSLGQGAIVDATSPVGIFLWLPRSSFSTHSSCLVRVPAYQQIVVTAKMIAGPCPGVAQNISLDISAELSTTLRTLTLGQPHVAAWSYFARCSNVTRRLTIEYRRTTMTGSCTGIRLYIAGKNIFLYVRISLSFSLPLIRNYNLSIE